MTGVAVTSGPTATIPALITVLQTAPELSGVLVRWGLLATLPTNRERIYLLGVADYERAAVSGGHRVRQEAYQIRGIVEVHDLAIEGPEEASSRAWALLEDVDTVLREDPDLGPARYTGTLRVALDETLPATDGWIGRILFRIEFFHNR